jgi:type IV secretory pathway VirB4 component
MTTQKTASAAQSSGRKAWIKKTPVEIVLEQIGKQEEKVVELREELAHEERELAKLQQARKVLEAQ